MTQCIAELQRNGNNLNEIEPESLESVGFHRDSEGDSENHNLKLYMNRSISQGVYLSPGDSLFRAVNLLKQVGNGLTTSLPVLDEFGRLIGRFDNAILPELLSATNSDTILQEPIARWISPLDFVANPDTLYEDVVQYFATGHESTVYFADYSGRYKKLTHSDNHADFISKRDALNRAISESNRKEFKQEEIGSMNCLLEDQSPEPSVFRL